MSKRPNRIIKILWKNKLSLVGFLGVFALIIIAVLAPVLAPYDPAAQNIHDRFKPPSITNLVGTDQYGRDLLSRIICGARISLLVGTCSVSIGFILGVAIGIFAGYKGGLVDALVMRAIDIMMTLPGLIMGMMIVALLGPSLFNLILAIAFLTVPVIARLTRSSTIAIKEKEFIQAAKSIGMGDLRIMVIHIFPNVISESIVMASLYVGNAIRIEANLSFIGIGVPPPIPSWGGLARDGMDMLRVAPWVAIFAGLAIMLVVWFFNMLGDGLRDVIDPHIHS